MMVDEVRKRLNRAIANAEEIYKEQYTERRWLKFNALVLQMFEGGTRTSEALLELDGLIGPPGEYRCEEVNAIARAFKELAAAEKAELAKQKVE